MSELVEEFLQAYKGKFLEEDVRELIGDGIDLSDLLNINEGELAKILREHVGRKRRKQWSYFPDEKEKEKIRDYLVEEIKKRPNISPVLFNALFGVGFNTYFSSWNKLKKIAGIEANEFTKRKYDYVGGKRIIVEYAVDTLKSGGRVTQEDLRKDLGIHYDNYGFNSMKKIKKVAFEIVVYEYLSKDPNIPLSEIARKLNYSRKVIDKYVNTRLLRMFAQMGAKQVVYFSEDEVFIGYKRE
jgi:hypothetical protein